MDEIRLLPAEEVEKIAAGEVVERPVSVVKEFVENALDAGARHVTVEVGDGGRRSIAVTDDGGGISFGELALAVRNFHTSKIRACDDIYHQTTLGFRGEALAAIGAVSKLTLTSRRADDELGGAVSVDGGRVGEARRQSLNPGTVVEVRELFFNTPVRRKFLRSRATELHHITNCVRNYILAFPEVAFSLVSDGKPLLASGGRGLTPEVLHSVFGADIGPHLSSFSREYPPLGVSGLIAPPSLYRETRKLQFFFVNRRPVKNRVMYRAVDDALQEHVSAGRFPPLVLYLEVPPEEVDVNIHPTKSEVSFLHQQQVYSSIVVTLKDAVRGAAGEQIREIKQELQADLPEPAQSATAPLSPLSGASPRGVRSIPVFEMGSPLVPDGPSVMQTEATRSRLSVVDAGAVVSLAREMGIPSFVHPEGKYFACQLATTYILLVKDGQLILIDQHAAHERVLFSGMWARLESDGREVVRQKLMFPLSIALAPDEIAVWREHLRVLKQLGFAVRFGEGEALVDEVPKLLLAAGDEERIAGVLEELVSSGRSVKLEEERKELVAGLACKGAIKAGDALKPAEIKLLLDELLSLDDAASCPHGRPTMIRLGTKELAKLFRRS